MRIVGGTDDNGVTVTKVKEEDELRELNGKPR